MSPTIQIRSTVFPNPLNQNPDFSRGSQFGGRPELGLTYLLQGKLAKAKFMLEMGWVPSNRDQSGGNALHHLLDEGPSYFGRPKVEIGSPEFIGALRWLLIVAKVPPMTKDNMGLTISHLPYLKGNPDLECVLAPAKK